jgi:hypothetical protein
MKLAVMLFLILLCGGCATTGTYRDQVYRWDARCETPEGLADEALKCKKHSIEHHVVKGDPAKSEKDSEYLLGVVEFDDQGWFQHARQMQVLMQELEKEGRDRELVISVFVHGWKHNAEYCDGNITCFRTLLATLATTEENHPAHRSRTGKSRRVFGVYVGWRGLSVLGPDIIRSTSFYDRKGTATQVALGSTRELLARLRDFHETRNTPAKPGDKEGSNRLFITGHSFGGLIVYTAVAQYLINSAIAPARKCKEPGSPGAVREIDGCDDRVCAVENNEFRTPGVECEERRRVVKGFGDLVVLINPAFEATRYQPLHHIAQTREYPRYQDPVFVSITSLDDTATGSAFPAGRRFSTLLDTYAASPEKIIAVKGKDQVHTKEMEKEANLRTVGHVDQFVTHVLVPTKGDLLEYPGTSQSDDCRCPFERLGIDPIDRDAERRRAKDFTDRMTEDGHRKRGWQRDYVGNLSLKHRIWSEDQLGPRDIESKPDSPFWVVQTDKPIIVEHNDFWTPHLLRFLRQVYDDILRDPEEPEKREVLEKQRPTAPK